MNMASILLVDDSEVVRFEVATALIKSGHVVHEGIHGREGLRIASSDIAIDLIITDLNMPDMDGIAMLKEVRKLPQRAAIPVFMLTTEASQSLRALGKEVGILMWLVKPFKAEKVLPFIDKVLSRSISA